MVSSAKAYAWSSARERLGQKPADLLDWHPIYLGLGRSEEERRQSYAQFLRESIPSNEWMLIRDSLQRGQLTGSAKFIGEIEKIAGIRIEQRGRGRPRKAIEED